MTDLYSENQATWGKKRFFTKIRKKTKDIYFPLLFNSVLSQSNKTEKGKNSNKGMGNLKKSKN